MCKEVCGFVGMGWDGKNARTQKRGKKMIYRFVQAHSLRTMHRIPRGTGQNWLSYMHAPIPHPSQSVPLDLLDRVFISTSIFLFGKGATEGGGEKKKKHFSFFQNTDKWISSSSHGLSPTWCLFKFFFFSWLLLSFVFFQALPGPFASCIDISNPGVDVYFIIR